MSRPPATPGPETTTSPSQQRPPAPGGVGDGAAGVGAAGVGAAGVGAAGVGAAELGHPRRWLILGVLVLSLLIVVLDNTVLNVALERISRPEPAGLAATQAQLQWSVNSYTLVFAGMLFTWGTLADRYGRRWILILGFVLFGLASLLSAYSQDAGQLVAARAAMGLGGAAVMPSTLAIISAVFHPRERAKAIGVWAGAVGIGIAVGPIVGGALLERFWWGSVFLINVPIVVVGLVLIALLVPESRNPVPGRLDPPGVLLQIVGLVALVYGIIRIGDLGTAADRTVVVPLLVGAVVLGLFVRHELRTDHPVLDVRLFRVPTFSAAVAAIGLTFFALMGVTFFMVFYLQVVRGYTPLEAGVRLLPLAIGQLVFSPQSARMVTRFGVRAVTTTGLSLVTASFLGFLLLDESSSIWLLEVLFFLQGAGMGNVMPPATEAVMSSMPRERAGAASAVNNTVRQVGGALGVAVLGTLLSAVYRREVTGDLAALPVPDGARAVASKSVQATDAVLDRLGPAGEALRGPAYDAFVAAMHVTALASAAVALAGILVVFRFLPGRQER